MNNYTIEDIFINDNLSQQRKTIAEIFDASPMFDCILNTVDNRHLVDQHGHWLADFATQDYLGLSFNPNVIDAAIKGTKQYGTVIAWCRLVATVELFNQAEQAIADLIHSETANIFASTTLLNHGVIPALLGKNGVMFLDKSGHATMYEGAKIARDSGSQLVSFDSNNIDSLEQLLKEKQHIPKKLIAVDGINSMTGEYTDLPKLDKLAKKYQALIYVDDAHGFGVIGEKPSINYPYGHTGNGLVQYFGLNYDNILYIGCFSKAYGTFGSFIGCSKKMRNFLLSQATPHDLGGAGPASAISALLAGLKINIENGDQIRKKITELTKKATTGLKELGFEIMNHTGFPIIAVRVPTEADMVKISKILYNHHILLTLAPYPMVAKGKEALRITVTASNTENEINQLIVAFANLKNYLKQL